MTPPSQSRTTKEEMEEESLFSDLLESRLGIISLSSIMLLWTDTSFRRIFSLKKPSNQSLLYGDLNEPTQKKAEGRHTPNTHRLIWTLRQKAFTVTTVLQKQGKKNVTKVIHATEARKQNLFCRSHVRGVLFVLFPSCLNLPSQLFSPQHQKATVSSWHPSVISATHRF